MAANSSTNGSPSIVGTRAVTAANRGLGQGLGQEAPMSAASGELWRAGVAKKLERRDAALLATDPIGA